MAKKRLQVQKVQDEFVVSILPSAGEASSEDEKLVSMWVQLKHDKGEPIRITLSKNPLNFKNPKDYHFEESRIEVVEAIALCMLEAVKLARAAK